LVVLRFRPSSTDDHHTKTVKAFVRASAEKGRRRLPPMCFVRLWTIGTTGSLPDACMLLTAQGEQSADKEQVFLAFETGSDGGHFSV
jgi:hypothetical protein